VAKIRSKVDFPAPLEPISATASPSPTVKETPARALSVEREIGCNRARQPVKAGGKYFSSAVTEMAGAGIQAVITEFAMPNPVESLPFDGKSG
jgi:hypothetical protein